MIGVQAVDIVYSVYFRLFCSKQCTTEALGAKSPSFLVLSDTAGRMGRETMGRANLNCV